MATGGTTSTRLLVLDGLRGWGAVFVLMYHVFCSGLRITPESASFLRVLLPFNGPYAVMIFFIVSGIALSYAYLRTLDDQLLIRAAGGRYIRLVIPILCLCLAVHLAIGFELLAPAQERLPTFSKVLNFESTIGHVLTFSFIDVFFRYSSLETYAGPLWTMSVELIGSLLLFAALFVAARTKHLFLVLSAISLIILIFATSYLHRLYALFLIGALIAAAMQRGWLEHLPSKLAAVVLLAGVLAPAFALPAYDSRNMVAAVALTIGCISFLPARRFLETRLSQLLGKVSFALYLVHGPVMMFAGDPLTQRYGDSIAMKVTVNVVVVALSFLAAMPMLVVTEYASKASQISGRLVEVGLKFIGSAVAKSSGRSL